MLEEYIKENGIPDQVGETLRKFQEFCAKDNVVVTDDKLEEFAKALYLARLGNESLPREQRESPIELLNRCAAHVWGGTELEIRFRGSELIAQQLLKLAV